jgi:integrase
VRLREYWTTTNRKEHPGIRVDIRRNIRYFLAMSIHQHGKNQRWFAVYLGIDHKQKWKALPLGINKRDAQDLANALQDAEHKKRDAKRLRDTLDEILGKESSENVPTIKDFLDDWIEHCRTETAAATFDNYQNHVGSFLEFLGPRAKTRINAITRQDLLAFRDSFEGNRTAITINQYLVTLKRAFDDAKIDKLISTNPVDGVRKVKGDSGGTRRAFTITELKAVLSAADEEWVSIIKFGLYTVLRLQDIVTLTWDNIDLDRNELHLTAHKTGKIIAIPLSSHLLEHIQTLKHVSKYLHPEAYNTFLKSHKKVSTLSNQFARCILPKAGVREKTDYSKKRSSGKREQSELSFHSLRHTAVSMFKDAGVPEAVAMELAGHSSTQMSARYTHTGLDALRKAAESLPRL